MMHQWEGTWCYSVFNHSVLLSETVTVNNEILVCCAVAHLVHSLSVFVCHNYPCCVKAVPH